MEYFERDGVHFALVPGDMTRSQHVHAQDVLNRALDPLVLAPLSAPYLEQFEAGGYRLQAQLPGPTRAVLVDEGAPFQRWEWADNEFAWLAFDINAALHHNPSTGEGARLVIIDDRSFQVAFADAESSQRFGARLDGFLREELKLMAHIIAPSTERRDQIVAGIASMRVVASPDAGA